MAPKKVANAQIRPDKLMTKSIKDDQVSMDKKMKKGKKRNASKWLGKNVHYCS